MSKRTEQVASVLQRAVQQVIENDLKDPRLEAIITITGVRVTEDLLTAVITVSVTPEKREGIAIHGLTAAARFIRRRAGDLIDMRKLPELVFRVDKGLKRHGEVLRILAELGQERADAQAHDTTQSPEETA